MGRLIEIEKDYSTLSDWWAAWKSPVIPKSMLPKLGWIVEEVAAGFLYQTDSAVAVIENLVVNPKCRGLKRTEGINEVGLTLKDMALKMGFQMVLAFSDHSMVVRRAEAVGFKRVGADYRLLSWRG